MRTTFTGVAPTTSHDLHARRAGPRPPTRPLDAALLPGPTALHHRIDERLATVAEAPASLVVIGLLRKDTGWPLSSGRSPP